MIQPLSELPPTRSDILGYILVGGILGEDEHYLHSLRFHFSMLEMH